MDDPKDPLDLDLEEVKPVDDEPPTMAIDLSVLASEPDDPAPSGLSVEERLEALERKMTMVMGLLETIADGVAAINDEFGP